GGAFRPAPAEAGPHRASRTPAPALSGPISASGRRRSASRAGM
ncbi:MAG: hypothetical protein AVDCRST_MAG08-1959, partial [uncultured Acetobacteraceae bacterium]